MENLLDVIKAEKLTYLATIDGDQARVRPMGQLVEIEGKLMWCTNHQKDVFKQVVAHPKVEFCLFVKGQTIRVFGTCLPSKSPSVKAEFLRLQPTVAKLYGGNEAILEIMVFEHATASVTTKGVKEETILY